MFDDSFEHEAINLTDARRIVLVVDVWHPELTSAERRTLHDFLRLEARRSRADVRALGPARVGAAAAFATR